MDDLAADVVEGFGCYDLNVHRGERISTSTAYLHRRARARISRCSPVRPHCASFSRTVARPACKRLATEAWSTFVPNASDRLRRRAGLAGLLMLSGIGPADELRAHGIAPVVDAPEVGMNLAEPDSALPFAVRVFAAGQRVQLSETLACAVHRGAIRADPRGAARGELRLHGRPDGVDPSHETPDIMTVMGAALLSAAAPAEAFAIFSQRSRDSPSARRSGGRAAAGC